MHWCIWAGIYFRETDSTTASRAHENTKIAKEIAFGIIGFGNMGQAIATGLRARKAKTIAFDINGPKVARFPFVEKAGSVGEVARKADFIFIAVKPHDAKTVLEELKSAITGHVLASVCAGVSITNIESEIGKTASIVRAMPNVAASVGSAPVFYCCNGEAEKQAGLIESCLTLLGTPLGITENMFDAATSAGGSGIAFVFEFLSSIEDSAVRIGFSREDSKEIALTLVEGAVRMARKRGMDFTSARNMVTSPGGTTAEGLQVLNRTGFRGIVSAAFSASKDKAAKITAAMGVE